jgi:hypothetical protein
MGVAVYQGGCLMHFQRLFTGLGVHIGQGGQVLLSGLALGAHGACLGQAVGQALRQKSSLPSLIPDLGAKGEVFMVIGAQGIAMAEQEGAGLAVDAAGLSQGLHAGVLEKSRSDQKVAVATQKKHRYALGASAQGLGAVLFKSAQGVVQHIVTHPGLKQVAQNEQGLGRGVGQIVLPCGGGERLTAVQVHIR